MDIQIISDDLAGGRRLADALGGQHRALGVVATVDEIGAVPAGAAFVVIAASAIALRLSVAKLRRRFGPEHAVVVAIGRSEASELPHVVAAGADDFVVWPREPEFLATRLSLIEGRRERVGGGPPTAPSARPTQSAEPPNEPPRVRRVESRPSPVAATLQALLKACPDTVYWLTADGVFRDLHTHDPESLPAPVSSLLRRRVEDVFAEDVAARFREALGAVLAGAPERRVAFSQATVGGREGRWEATLVKVNAAEALAAVRPEGGAGAGDESDGRSAEGPGDSRRFIARVALTVPLTLFVYNLDTRRLVYLNRPLGTALGLSVVDALNTGLERFVEVVHPDDLPAIVAGTRRWGGVADGEVVERAFRVRKIDRGWSRMVSRETVFRRDAGGRPVEIVGALMDAAEEVAPREGRSGGAGESPAVEGGLELALAGPDDVVYSWDFATGVFAARGTSRLGEGVATRDEWMGRIHEGDRPVVEAALERHLETGAPYSESLRLRVFDGTWRHFVDRGVAVRDAEGRPQRWVGVCTDITDRVLHQRKLSIDQKMEAVAHLAGGVAQDFNKVLLAVFTHLDMALSRLSAGAPVRVDLVDARQAAEKAATLTRQLLAFGRRQALQPEYISVNDVIGDILDTLTRRVGSSVELSFESSEHLGTVLADPMQIEQILLTLCSRARDAMPRGGRLAVTTTNVRARDERALGPGRERDARYVKIRVEDSGEPIPEELLAHVFDPFFAAADGGPRTGLELAMVHGVVDQHEGVIAAENLPGGGVALSIFLPVVERPPARLRRPEVATRGGDETVLLVDDDELVRNMAARMLRGAGYTVVTAADGAEGLKALRERREVALVVLDVVMPRMGGRATWEVMEREMPGKRYLFISGYTMTAQDTDFVQHGGRRFLPKPFNSGQLLREVRAALDGGVA